MAEDNLLTEYHLTPTGWVQATERFFRRVSQDGEVKRPKDAVETWERHIYESPQIPVGRGGSSWMPPQQR